MSEEPNYKQLYEELQLELMRQIILSHFNQTLAANSGVKESFYFFRGWKEACIKLLNGEVSDNVEENLKRAEANINMQDTVEKLDNSIKEGLSLL